MLERADFVDLIPHAGPMCLIERVADWDDDHLRALTAGHRDPDHPLARGGRLAALHALEFAAQAMAIHGALRAARAGTTLAPGFLAGARHLALHAARLDDRPGDLVIDVERRFAQQGDLIYGFSVAAGDTPLATGSATVVAR